MILVFLIAAVVVLILQDFLFTQLAPERLDYSCAFDRVDAVEGDSVHMIETVKNNKPLPVLWMMADIHTSAALDYGEEWTHRSLYSQRVTSLFTLGGRTKVTRTWNVSCLRRGVTHIEYVTLIWGGLIGYRLSSQARRCGARLTVYPGLVDLDAMFKPVNLNTCGALTRRFIIDDPFIFAGVREYMPTDPQNRVHWGATARHGTLMVRQNDYTSELTVVTALNIQAREFENRESCDPARSELAIKVAATVAQRAIRSGALCSLTTNASVTGETTPVRTDIGSGTEHLTAIYDVLARLECINRREFADSLDDLALTQRNAEIVIVTLYLTDRLCERCEALRIAGNSVKVLLINGYADQSGEDAPRNFDLYVLDDADIQPQGEEDAV